MYEQLTCILLADHKIDSSDLLRSRCRLVTSQVGCSGIFRELCTLRLGARMQPKQKKNAKTYNRRDSQMVTHSSTSRPVQCLCMAERTGCPVLTDLWSYVLYITKTCFMKRICVVVWTLDGYQLCRGVLLRGGADTGAVIVLFRIRNRCSKASVHMGWGVLR
jgi:hypothetical protein